MIIFFSYSDFLEDNKLVLDKLLYLEVINYICVLLHLHLCTIITTYDWTWKYHENYIVLFIFRPSWRCLGEIWHIIVFRSYKLYICVLLQLYILNPNHNYMNWKNHGNDNFLLLTDFPWNGVVISGVLLYLEVANYICVLL